MAFKKSTISCFTFYYLAISSLFFNNQCAAGNASVGNKTTVRLSDARTDRIFMRAAENFLQNMNQSADPCSNFYNFVCGGYMERTADFDTTNPQNERYQTFMTEIEDLLESDRDMPASKVSVARNIYANCMALDLDKSNKKQVIETIAAKVGLLKLKNGTGYEPRYEWNKNFNWIDSVHKLREMGMNFRFLLGLYVTPRSQTDKRNILEVRQPFLSNDAAPYFEVSSPEKLRIGKAGIFFQAFKHHFPLIHFIQGLLPEDVKFSWDDEIRVDLNYMKSLVTWLKNKSNAYAIRHKLFKKIESEVEKLLFRDSLSELERKSQCIHTAIYYDYNFQVAVSERFLPEKKKNFATEIMSQVLETAKTLINISASFDDESKPEFINRLTNMQLMSGNSYNTIDSPALDWTDVDHTKYVQNIFNISKHQMDAKFRQINLVKDVREWDYDMIPSVENAMYAPMANNLYIPALEVATMMYQQELPNYMHFGTVGIDMAHELGHAIDLSVLDPSGDSLKFTRSKLKECRECLLNGFYEIREENKIDIAEDFADLAGFKTAYYSFLESQKFREDPSLPGLYYNPRQMFWISSASLWCSKDAFENSPDELHSPNSVRVLLPLSNLPEFARDFNCPVGSPMNPESKCKFL